MWLPKTEEGARVSFTVQGGFESMVPGNSGGCETVWLRTGGPQLGMFESREGGGRLGKNGNDWRKTISGNNPHGLFGKYLHVRRKKKNAKRGPKHKSLSVPLLGGAHTSSNPEIAPVQLPGSPGCAFWKLGGERG